MREIKFRAKMVDFDGWAHGHYVNYGYNYKPEAGHFIIRPDKKYEIYPGTLGQYTGLKDIDGIEIYEGDIVRMSGDYKPGVYTVIWDYYRSAWWLKNIKADTRKLEMDDDYCQLLGNGWQNEHREVIGNIHELLEVAE